jgi:hypothetical protein
MNVAPDRLACPAPKNSAACDNCHLQKTRCLPSKIPGTCRRFVKLIIWAACTHYLRCKTSQSKCSINRTRRVGGRKRKANMIKDAEIPPADSNAGPVTNSANVVSGLLSAIVSSTWTAVPKVVSFLEHHRSMINLSFPFGLTAPPTSIENSNVISPYDPDQAIDSKSWANMNSSEAKEYLRLFHQQLDRFPFVFVSEEVDFDTLQKTRPILALGIITAMSKKQPQQQKRLDTIFRKVVSERVIVHSEQSLDILQGLLVYLAWCVFPFRSCPKLNW